MQRSNLIQRRIVPFPNNLLLTGGTPELIVIIPVQCNESPRRQFVSILNTLDGFGVYQYPISLRYQSHRRRFCRENVCWSISVFAAGGCADGIDYRKSSRLPDVGTEVDTVTLLLQTTLSATNIWCS